MRHFQPVALVAVALALVAGAAVSCAKGSSSTTAGEAAGVPTSSASPTSYSAPTDFGSPPSATAGGAAGVPASSARPTSYSSPPDFGGQPALPVPSRRLQPRSQSLFPSTPAAPASAIAISPDSLSLGIGSAAQLAASAGADNVTNSVRWYSDDSGVATVDGSGLVTGMGQGSTRIHATLDGMEASINITVG